MKFINYMFFIVSALLIWSCKNDSSSTVENDPVEETTQEEEAMYMPDEKFGLQNQYEVKNPDKLTVMRNMHINLASEKIPPLRESAIEELEAAWKASGKKAHVILDKDLYVFDRIHDGNAMSDDKKFSKFWIDFDKDLTYKYGEGNEEKGSGRYFYNFDNYTLLLVDNDEAIKPNKYDVKLAGEALVLVGRADYHDNNWQAKLRKSTERPE